MNIVKKVVSTALVVCSALFSGCFHDEGDDTGVCTGYNPSTMNTYCKNNWTKDECADWNSQKVNGVDWYFHEGQTCADRGLDETP